MEPSNQSSVWRPTKHLNKSKGRLLALSIIMFFGLLVPARPAAAASCYNTGCEGRDPYASGCNSNYYAVYTKAVYNGGGGFLGYVKLMYSNSCGANWAQVESAVGVTSLWGHVWRQSNGVGYSDSGNYSTLWTNMTGTATATACAEGTIAGVYGFAGCA